MLWWKYLICVLSGYLVGTINPAYIIGRLRGFDIRRKGSGNAGASNAVIVMGKAVGVFSALFDIFKASALMWLAPVVFGDLALAPEITGVCVVIGHVFPVFLHFKGGKGLASLGGVLLAIDWRVFLVTLGIAVVLVLITDYIATAPVLYSVALPLMYGILGASGLDLLDRAAGGWLGAAVLAIGGGVVLVKHLHNVNRILHGAEVHFSFMWSKDKEAELARVHRNAEVWQAKKAQKKAAKESMKR